MRIKKLELKNFRGFDQDIGLRVSVLSRSIHTQEK